MTNTTKTYFTVSEALEDIKETLLNGCNSYGSDLHGDVFNTGYYIIGTYEAKQALEQYGTFDAIGEVVEYEESEFGERTTDITDPEKVANMLYYMKGNEAISELMEKSELFDELWNEQLDEESCKAIVKDIDRMLESGKF